jgi:hypothetical protein
VLDITAVAVLKEVIVCSYIYFLLFILVTANNSIGTNPNWELLAPRGYRFYMPGSVGPAWHDAFTTVHTQEFESTGSHQTSKKVQERFSIGQKNLQ